MITLDKTKNKLENALFENVCECLMYGAEEKTNMKTLKCLIDFYNHLTMGNGTLELYFTNHNLKVGDNIVVDLCMFKNEQTLVKGKILKAYKHKVVMTKEYI